MIQGVAKCMTGATRQPIVRCSSNISSRIIGNAIAVTSLYVVSFKVTFNRYGESDNIVHT